MVVEIKRKELLLWFWHDDALLKTWLPFPTIGSHSLRLILAPKRIAVLEICNGNRAAQFIFAARLAKRAKDVPYVYMDLGSRTRGVASCS